MPQEPGPVTCGPAGPCHRAEQVAERTGDMQQYTSDGRSDCRRGHNAEDTVAPSKDGPCDCSAPPGPQRVACRALILSAVVCRSNSDHDPSNPDAISLWGRMKKWVESLNVASEIESAEAEMLYAALGSLDNQKRIYATWRAEGLGILAWALRRFPFPKHDQRVDPYELTDSLAFLDDGAARIIQSAELRPRAELDACRELLYAIHCRLREFERRKEARSITSWIEPAWLEMLEIGSPLGPTGDLRVGETEISGASAEAVNRYGSAVYERHRAAIWLAGADGPLYSQVPVDT